LVNSDSGTDESETQELEIEDELKRKSGEMKLASDELSLGSGIQKRIQMNVRIWMNMRRMLIMNQEGRNAWRKVWRKIRSEL
jgi:hypothetical protein